MRKGQLTLWLLYLLCHAHGYTQQSTNLPGLSTYFDEAYWRYPNIPRGILEATAYSASRLTNLQPTHNDRNQITGMPERYGLFALVENGRGYFKNNLIRVCEASSISPEQFKKDVRLQVLAVAKFLGREATARRMSMQVSAEDFAGVLERLSEIPDDGSAINNYAQALYNYDIYDKLQKGFEDYPPVPVDLNRIFADSLLLKLQAREVTLATAEEGGKTNAVTLYSTEGSYAAAISWLKNQSAIQYVVRASDGQVTRIANGNSTTTGIAHEGFAGQGAKWYTDLQYQTSAALVRKLAAKSPVRVNNAEPGKYWNWAKYNELITPKAAAPMTQADYITIPDGVYRITNVNSLKAMNARDGSSKVSQLSWSGNDAQRWQFESTGDGWYLITNKLNGRVLEVPACSQEIVPVMLYELKSHDCQKWRILKTGAHQVRLVNKASGKVLEVAAGANANESVIQQNRWTERNWQKWIVAPVGPQQVAGR